jgi:methylated-DNA-[protein]-cysteine S-methyltransferase
MKIMKAKIKSPLGSLTAYSDGNKLRGLFFAKDRNHFEKMQLLGAETVSNKDDILKSLEAQLDEYFAGHRKYFELPLHVHGTDFQKLAWRALTQIPYGQTVSYSKQAISMKKKNAVRAAGSANGSNLFPILIPCHRVIRSDGSLGGYAGGLDLKKKLLQLEGSSRQTLS